jgi:DNA repair ATPase RecN
VDLHGQHEHWPCSTPTLTSSLDRFAGAKRVPARGRRFASVEAARATLAGILDPSATAGRANARFQLAELDRAPASGEDEELSGLRTLLASADPVRRLAMATTSL